MPSSPGSTMAEPKRYYDAWAHYLRFGLEPSREEPGISDELRATLFAGRNGEKRDMGTGGKSAYPGASAGFFVPTAFADQYEAALANVAPMLEVSRSIDTPTGAPLGYPTDSDVSVIGELLSEHAQATKADVPMSQITFSTFKFGSKFVIMSTELAQDFGFDLMGYLAEKFAWRVGRALNPLMTTGTGIGGPQGVITGAPVGRVATGSGGGGTGATSIGSDDLTALEMSVDFAYHKGAIWMCNASTLQVILDLKDNAGRPIVTRPDQPGMPTMLNGYPVILNPDFPVIAPNAITLAFGRFDKYLVRRGPKQLIRLAQRWADFSQVGFILWDRRDGRLIDAGTHPIKTLQQAASVSLTKSSVPVTKPVTTSK